jgi:caffeoyl-CoA O-methyltransferase
MPDKYVKFTEGLYEYMLEKRSNAQDPVIEALLAETANLGEVASMSISLDQASLMTLLVAAIGAKWAVEVGTFTGMSSIAIARGLAPGGKLTCFDSDFKWTSIARRYWMKAGVQEKIELRLGDAHRLLPHYRAHTPFDFVFIDADKEAYDFYYETLLPQVRKGGLILFDNMLRGGQVIDPEAKFTMANRAVDALNHKLASDPRVQAVLLPIADGLYLCRKR